MQIFKINFLSQNKSSQVLQQNNSQKEKHNSNQNNTSINYPKNYRPYFGARLNRTPENFYEQEFNLQNMPKTVKNLLMKDLETNKLKRPMELQQEAFFWLTESTNIQDVKDMYPDEPLFADLETLETIRPSHGYLCDLRILGAKNKTVLKSGEDLTVYLLKKVYLEGKDLAEINQDFKQDVKEDYLDEENYPDGYFQYSTLKSLGVHFPNISYWHSLQATRLDKEYIPSTRTFDPTKERKTRVYTPRKPREISAEERQKRSERMIERWLDMSPVQRANQIAKMKAGQIESDNIFLEYESPIMIIAAEESKLSDKMIEFFREDSETKYPTDLSKLTKIQHLKMKKFWDNNPYLKKQFSAAIIKTINCFKLAKELDDGSIENLIKSAENIQIKNAIRAKQRELSSDEGIKKSIIEQLYEQSEFFPEMYKTDYSNYIFNSKEFKNNIKPAYAQLVYQPNNVNLQKLVQKALNDMAMKYLQSHKRMTMSANIAVASVFIKYDSSDPTILTANTYGISAPIDRSIYKESMRMEKAEIERRMKEYTSGFSDEELNKIYKIFLEMMKVISKSGYTTLGIAGIRKKAAPQLTKICKKLEKDKTTRNEFKTFIKDYEGYIKYANSSDATEKIRYYLYESIIDDYVQVYTT